MTRKKLSLVFLLALAVTAFYSCKDDAPPPGPDILPGVGLKEVKIGDTANDAFDAYGPTTSTYVEVNGEYIHFLAYQSIGILIVLEPSSSTTLDNNTKIKSFSLDAPYSGKTAEDIGIGSTKTDVRTAYGQPNISDATTDTYIALGISFSYDGAEKVTGIAVSDF